MKKCLFIALAVFLFASTANAETRLIHPEWDFSDDFEGELDTDFWESGGPSISYGVPCPGSDTYGNTLVFNYRPDDPEPGHGWAEKRFSLPVDAVQIEMSYRLFVPANYVHASGNHKNFVLWSGDYGKVNANISVSSESWPTTGGASPSVYIGVDGSNYGHSMKEGHPLFLEDNLGDWIDVHVYLELAEEEGDFGRFEISKNGDHMTGNHDEDLTSYANTPPEEQISFADRGNFIDQGYLLGWANGGFEVDTDFCVADFRMRANSVHGEAADDSLLECTTDNECPSGSVCEVISGEPTETRCTTTGQGDTDTGDDAGPDTGTPDSGTPDTGTSDAGTSDAGTSDADESDSSGDEQYDSNANTNAANEGCSCSSTGGAQSTFWGLMGLVTLGLIRLGRRRGANG